MKECLHASFLAGRGQRGCKMPASENVGMKAFFNESKKELKHA